MKKIFYFIFILIMTLPKTSYADDISEVIKRLDKIDKRISEIEEKLNFLDLFNGQEINTLTSRSENKKDPFLANIDTTITNVTCKKAEYFGNDLKISGYFKNNYEKGIKLIDGAIVIKDLFGDTVGRLAISKNTKIRTDMTASFINNYNFTSDDDCKNLNNENLSDYKFGLDIRRIAFEDNTIVEF